MSSHLSANDIKNERIVIKNKSKHHGTLDENPSKIIIVYIAGDHFHCKKNWMCYTAGHRHRFSIFIDLCRLHNQHFQGD